jgi:hypothetical protein
MGEVFRDALIEKDLINTTTVAVVSGTFIKLGERKVEAGEMLTIGYGSQAGQTDAVGRFYLSLKDTTATPVQLHGKVRLSVYSPQNRPLRILGEYRTETLLSGGTADRSLNTPLPENFTWLSEDKKLVLEFQSDTNATLSQANSDMLMDITVEAV